MTWDEVFVRAQADIKAASGLTDDLMRLGHIAQPPSAILNLTWDMSSRVFNPRWPRLAFNH